MNIPQDKEEQIQMVIQAFQVWGGSDDFTEEEEKHFFFGICFAANMFKLAPEESLSLFEPTYLHNDPRIQKLASLIKAMHQNISSEELLEFIAEEMERWNLNHVTN